MFSIGDIKIKNRVVLAPMAGVTDKAYRIIAKSYNCGLAYTEMVSDMGLIYSQAKTAAIADTTDEEPPVSVQIFGSEVEPMIKAAVKVQELGAKIIDINMGCPTPKIVKNGEGAALMRNLPRVREIIKGVKNAINVPLTIKMRKGWDENQLKYIELATIAEEEGVSAIAFHARTRDQFYSGKADWDCIKNLKKTVSIPVIGNGDIWSAEDALKMLDYTNCDAVMIGRAAMGNPFILREAVELIENGKKIPPPTTEEIINTAIRQLGLTIHYKGEHIAVREMRKHFSWYTKGLNGAAKLRGEINQAETKEQMISTLKKIKV
ncbi:tRNA-dihydrouridine synthase DusB [Candidatus Syntrophocurvum alkaliphilum]|uniref:tRNA-dihydrouridine synthase n=1 Tax=Candidatus Syntrophocurvum alkaliphilum TaxID=2293317 RepID=A0A6I6DKN5_9FIRM|nr:tRNA dihydrouridine synthase DusB [Candidatus Syntrophocurvum alkaliphilum]QGU00500.1 tRNA-dihydrouridine synthase DusB [Candidatus Syntrophocurvum alkaliphilum]